MSRGAAGARPERPGRDLARPRTGRGPATTPTGAGPRRAVRAAGLTGSAGPGHGLGAGRTRVGRRRLRPAHTPVHLRRDTWTLVPSGSAPAPLRGARLRRSLTDPTRRQHPGYAPAIAGGRVRVAQPQDPGAQSPDPGYTPTPQGVLNQWTPRTNPRERGQRQPRGVRVQQEARRPRATHAGTSAGHPVPGPRGHGVHVEGLPARHRPRLRGVRVPVPGPGAPGPRPGRRRPEHRPVEAHRLPTRRGHRRRDAPGLPPRRRSR